MAKSFIEISQIKRPDAPVDERLCNVVIFVAVECLISRDGKKYKGTLNRTKDGIACQPWNRNTVSQT